MKNIFLKRIFIVVLVSVISINLANGKNVYLIIDSLSKTYCNSDDAHSKIPIIIELSHFYLKIEANSKRDSIIAVGISLAKQNNFDTSEILLYIDYFQEDEYFNSDSAFLYVNRFINVSDIKNIKDWKFEANICKAKCFIKIKNYDSAILYSKIAMSIITPFEKKMWIEGLLVSGNCFEEANKKIDAFSNYTNAVSLAQKTEDFELLFNCYSHLSDFYRLISNYNMALFYNNKISTILLAQSKFDSLKYMQSKNELALIYFEKNDRVNGESICSHVINFAIRNNYNHLKSKAFKYFRSYLVKNGLFSDLYSLYVKQYPEEFQTIKNNDTNLFFRLSAFIQEGKGNSDSAKLFYKIAEERLLKNNTEKIFLSNFLKRYGQFLLRQNDLEGAKVKFIVALECAQKGHYFPFMVELTNYLDSIYCLQKNYSIAHKYAQLNKAYSDSLSLTTKDSELLQLEIKNEESQLIYAEDKEKEKIATRHKAQLTGFFVGFVFLIIIVIVVLRNYRIERKLNKLLSTTNNLLNKEKKRSDDLLLNILPAEVAEELKDTGASDAKYFDNVTVLFTDFKGFTKVSERLTPQQLVNELHNCFKEFDLIMSKYNIEKIKTVGDAYLAVAGLPIADPNHAINITMAAIEIRQFMLDRKIEKKDDTFEIRIGINSGNVVAGIVGVKKFAYDIWGDTVNTAARMEQNCEAGKINISQSTYELVKHKFNCTYRGEIHAKNKGELKMYFLEC